MSDPDRAAPDQQFSASSGKGISSLFSLGSGVSSKSSLSSLSASKSSYNLCFSSYLCSISRLMFSLCYVTQSIISPIFLTLSLCLDVLSYSSDAYYSQRLVEEAIQTLSISLSVIQAFNFDESRSADALASIILSRYLATSFSTFQLTDFTSRMLLLSTERSWQRHSKPIFKRSLI